MSSLRTRGGSSLTCRAPPLHARRASRGTSTCCRPKSSLGRVRCVLRCAYAALPLCVRCRALLCCSVTGRRGLLSPNIVRLHLCRQRRADGQGPLSQAHCGGHQGCELEEREARGKARLHLLACPSAWPCSLQPPPVCPFASSLPPNCSLPGAPGAGVCGPALLPPPRPGDTHRGDGETRRRSTRGLETAALRVCCCALERGSPERASAAPPLPDLLALDSSHNESLRCGAVPCSPAGASHELLHRQGLGLLLGHFGVERGAD